MPSISLNWFGFLVLLGLFTCATGFLYYIQYSKCPKNNYHPVYSNKMKLSTKFHQ